MSDLISRQATIEEIWNVFNNYANDNSKFDEYETEAINMAFKVLQNRIEEQPTAYDKEKVVEQLEEMSDDIPIQYDSNYEKGLDDGIGYAIDIVRKGGVE